MMIRRMVLVLFAAAWGIAFLWGQASGHTVFKKQIQKKFENLVVKCEACHVKGKPKTERNEFGELFYQEMKADGLTAQWEQLKGVEKKKFETEVMAPKFDKVLELVREKTNPEGVQYGALLTDGKLPNTRIRSDDEDEDDYDDEDEEDDDGDGGDGGGR